MKLNSEIKLCTKNLLLVPYRKHHVQKYHEWMQSAELQKLTASIPLTLEEEYEMQQSWQKDENKCTFILLDNNTYEQSGDEIESMIGDTNIFIKDKDSGTGEIEIMIAEKYARGKKLGWEAAIIMLLYGINEIDLKRFEAKISFENEISISLFKKLGFEEISRSEIFQEVTLEKVVTDEWVQWLTNNSEFKILSHVFSA